MDDGRLLYRVKQRWRDGTTHIVLEPLELLEKLAAFVPPLLEVRAVLADRCGNPQDAHRKLREAHRLYTEMAATGHAERLEKQFSS